jgi:hypothetical protein
MRVRIESGLASGERDEFRTGPQSLDAGKVEVLVRE